MRLSSNTRLVIGPNAGGPSGVLFPGCVDLCVTASSSAFKKCLASPSLRCDAFIWIYCAYMVPHSVEQSEYMHSIN